MARKQSPIVALARRRVHSIIRVEIDKLRRQAEQQEDLYTRQDLNTLADQVERAVFGDE